MTNGSSSASRIRGLADRRGGRDTRVEQLDLFLCARLRAAEAGQVHDVDATLWTGGPSLLGAHLAEAGLEPAFRYRRPRAIGRHRIYSFKQQGTIGFSSWVLALLKMPC